MIFLMIFSFICGWVVSYVQNKPKNSADLESRRNTEFRLHIQKIIRENKELLKRLKND